MLGFAVFDNGIYNKIKSAADYKYMVSLTGDNLMNDGNDYWVNINEIYSKWISKFGRYNYL